MHKWEFFTSPSQYGNTLEGHNYGALLAIPDTGGTLVRLKNPVCNRAGIITQIFPINQAENSKNFDNFHPKCTIKKQNNASLCTWCLFSKQLIKN